MRKTFGPDSAVRNAGYMLSFVLALLVVAAATAAPTAPPVNIDPPTITGTPRGR